MKMRLKCRCGTILSADAASAGKRARCKNCSHTFTIPEPAAESVGLGEDRAFTTNDVAGWLNESPLTSAATASASTSDSGFNKTDRQLSAEAEVAGAACPECAAEIGESIVCIQCGYHTQLNRKLQTLDAEHVANTKWLIILLSLPVCTFYVFSTYLLLDKLDGPQFLQFFFGGVCFFGILLPVLRKMWLDTDIFNYLALGTLETAGLIRLLNALMEHNFRISFLLLGMVIIPLVFLLPRTEDGGKPCEPFQAKHGGLAATPYGLLLAAVLAVLAAVYFVPPISEVVAPMAWGVPMFTGMFVLGILNPSSKTGGSGSSSCSSCGGGCGGGCGGCGG